MTNSKHVGKFPMGEPSQFQLCFSWLLVACT